MSILLVTFSCIYFAERLVGANDSGERSEVSNRRNPWIIPKVLQLNQPVYTGKHINALIWKSFHMIDGSIPNEVPIRRLIYQGGVEEVVRRDVWLYLLKLRKADMTGCRVCFSLLGLRVHCYYDSFLD